MKILVLKRFDDQRITHEDPVTVLEDVYSGFSDPHLDLQTWSRKFLTQNTILSHPLDLATPYETSNLWKLQNISTLQPRFTALTGRSGALIADVSNAYDELRKLPHNCQSEFEAIYCPNWRSTTTLAGYCQRPLQRPILTNLFAGCSAYALR